MHPHLAALIDALAREQRAQEEEAARLRALPMPARVAAGFSLAPLELVSTEHRSRGRVNVLLRGRDLGEAFTPGDPIVLAPLGRPDDGIPGRIEGVDESTVELRVDGTPEGRGPWAVSRRLDFGLFALQVAAMQRAEEKHRPLVKLLLGQELPYRADPLAHEALRSLHPDQRAAAELALGATELGLVHGPPGTGKTEVLVAMMRVLKDLGETPWALAESNAAVDHLALRAHAAGLDVVRLGVSARIGGEVRPLTLEHRILHGARAAVIQRLVREATRASGPALDEVRSAIREEWSAAKREILASADVLAMTLGTLHTRGEDLPAPRTALVDEAGQVMEPALWLLATRVKRIILAGDPQQLGPVVKGRDPVLERSLLQRLVEAGFHFPMLTEQRRMNDALMALAQPVYGGRLSAAPAIAERTLEVESAWSPPAARFLDTAGMGFDEQPDALGSLSNPGEVTLLQKVWRDLREAGVRPEQVGVVAPYRAQVQALRLALPELEVGTVNAFQGREKDVILASFTRSNPDGELGFVADPRRLNVTLTRARLLFVGVGDSATLGGWAPFARMLERVGEGYVSGWDVDLA
jgi:hypothetical protein